MPRVYAATRALRKALKLAKLVREAEGKDTNVGVRPALWSEALHGNFSAETLDRLVRVLGINDYRLYTLARWFSTKQGDEVGLPTKVGSRNGPGLIRLYSRILHEEMSLPDRPVDIDRLLGQGLDDPGLKQLLERSMADTSKMTEEKRRLIFMALSVSPDDAAYCHAALAAAIHRRNLHESSRSETSET